MTAAKDTAECTQPERERPAGSGGPPGVLKALIVEDVPAIRLYLQSLLRKWGFQTAVAGDGEEAWRYLLDHEVHLLISDWMMPKVSGLDLCRQLRRSHLPQYVYTILVTARCESEDLLEGMRAGADDFLAKPINARELEVRIEAARRVIALQEELARRNRYLSEVNRELQRAQRAIDRDLQAAALMQSALLPQAALVGSVDLDSLFLPSSVVAGDLLSWFSLNERELAFYHVDVAGHGVPSAMLAFTLSKVLAASADEGSPVRLRAVGGAGGDGERLRAPAEVVAELNRRFQVEDDSMPYFTMVFGVIDTLLGRVRLCQAGHPHPLLVSRSGVVSVIGEGGFPVGLLPDADYHTIELALSPGDRLYLYSDGVSECQREGGEEAFGNARLERQLATACDQPLDRVMGGLRGVLRGWRGSAAFDDDVSVLALEFRPGLA